MTANPNEYDDGAYSEAAMEVSDEVDDLVQRLWKTGASADDIRNEFSDALRNALLRLGVS